MKTTFISCFIFLWIITAVQVNAENELNANNESDVPTADSYPIMLTDEQIERIKKLKEMIKDVDSLPLEKTLQNFAGDQDPEKEILVMETIAQTYQEEIIKRKISDPAAKKAIFKTILLISMNHTLEELYTIYPEAKNLTEVEEIANRLEKNFRYLTLQDSVSHPAPVE